MAAPIAAPTAPVDRKPPSGVSLAGTNATLSRKLKKVLDITLDDHMRTSLDAVSDFCVGPGRDQADWERDRRNLRGMLEKRTLDLHHSFLQDFGRVNEQFARVTGEIDALCGSCTRVKERLQGTREESRQLVDHLAVLQQELAEARRKEQQVTAFLERFHLSPEDKKVLKGEVGPAFFQVLDKVKDIHSHCEELLSAQHQQAGIEIMEMTYVQQMEGYDRLYKWVQHMVVEVMGRDTPEVPSLFVRGMHTLRDRDALWTQLMHEIIRQRKTAIQRLFSTALTRGSAHARAIELNAHDAQRYTGDMLAWVHQAVAEEGEMVEAFFSGVVAARRGGSPVKDGPPQAGDQLTKVTVLAQIFEGVAGQLKMRIEQVLETAAGGQRALVVLFRLESVLQFYANTIPQSLGEDALLAKRLVDLKLETLKRFFDQLKVLSDRLMSSQASPGFDLAPPAVFDDALKKLREMMDTLATSLVPPEDREREFAAVLNGIVDPLVSLVERVTDLGPSARCILMINSVCRILSVMEGHDFVGAKQAKLLERVQSDVGALVDSQSDDLMGRAQLSQLVGAVRSGRAPLAQSPATSEAAIGEGLVVFYQYVYKGAISVPLCEKIQSVRLREEAGARISKRVSDAYATVHAAVSDPRNGYKNPQGMLKHSPQEVAAMLGSR
eukprot:TRINITY_DN40598_c0_g1_i1.p1 TRINITY_DN40598_c0_g1~~TRINITY_DN40598_c0_g1_i1.p1  ORF type:complete len:665 (+),score=227.79 TRINITY_DN40598_c0_g1_i1:68-2062(+)